VLDGIETGGEVAQEQHHVRPGPPGLAALHRADLHLEGALGPSRCAIPMCSTASRRFYAPASP
jgi:hypothetical protein